MPDTLPVFLKQRAESSFLYLQKQTQDLTPTQALRYHDSHWPDHRWGIGQDGSIAGIVYHVAAWKQMTIDLFARDGIAIDRGLFDATSAPAPDDWPALLDWLDRIGTEWNTRLSTLPETVFDETREWAGATITLADYVTEMLEHDIQHAAQVEYLKQRMKAEE
jgi:hypothetical protein